MKEIEAINQAVLRWGNNARVRVVPFSESHVTTSYQVGFQKAGRFHIQGWGESWDQAIAHADLELPPPGAQRPSLEPKPTGRGWHSKEKKP